MPPNSTKCHNTDCNFNTDHPGALGCTASKKAYVTCSAFREAVAGEEEREEKEYPIECRPHLSGGRGCYMVQLGLMAWYTLSPGLCDKEGRTLIGFRMEPGGTLHMRPVIWGVSAKPVMAKLAVFRKL